MPDAGARHLHVVLSADDDGARLDQAIARHVPALSRSQVHRLIRNGNIRLSKGRAKPALAVWAGLEIDLDIPAPPPRAAAAEALPLSVLYADDELAVIDKPAGMVVHPAVGHAK